MKHWTGPSRAGRMMAIVEFVCSLGSKPPWWRPFARRAWQRDIAYAREQMKEMDQYS